MREIQSIATRQSLLERLKNWSDQQSWQEFFDSYWRLINAVALKAGLTELEAQEVVQDTVIAVAKNIEGFRYDPAVCSFKTWLLRFTRWRILDVVRKRKRQRKHLEPGDRDMGDSPAIDQVPDPAIIRIGREQRCP